jgi:hypothetical protein
MTTTNYRKDWNSKLLRNACNLWQPTRSFAPKDLNLQEKPLWRAATTSNVYCWVPIIIFLLFFPYVFFSYLLNPPPASPRNANIYTNVFSYDVFLSSSAYGGFRLSVLPARRILNYCMSFFLLWRNRPQWTRASFSRLHDHTQTHHTR